ncbi:MAG: hypothetical protein AUJ71_00060 [Candidatus Omnitrophica bacterium CG1_02_49_16]|nr:MAG: hypothetical protein AUJ71_00060 [Candidatus Omnitrophica bacterium CG1_02_49_16]
MSNSVTKSIEAINRKEYKIDSTARVAGKTVGALIYFDSIVDAKGQVSKEIHEAMGKVMQSVTRVALSTDLALDFCTVVIRDRRQGNELLITRSLDDTKRANAEAVGIEESINRTVFGQGKYKPGPGDSGAFVLKEVKLENFLTEQIVQRIRFGFSKESAAEETPRNSILVDGLFDRESGTRSFRFSMISIKSGDPKKMMLTVFNIINDVLKGYSFNGFDKVEIQDYLNRKKLIVDRQTILDYQQKKVTEAQILDKCLVESQSIQEAFKLFGFSLPQEVKDKDAAVPRSAAP